MDSRGYNGLEWFLIPVFQRRRSGPAFEAEGEALKEARFNRGKLPSVPYITSNDPARSA